jgi:tRNA(Ile)-lysidine synthase
LSAQPAPVAEQEPVLAGEAEALFADLANQPRLLVAVSGGPDSVTLLALLAEWAGRPGRPEIVAATIDHGLREGSAAEAQAVARFCDGLGVPHALLPWLGPKPATGLQNRARTARYHLLAREAERRGGAVVVTAHTLDDQAETLLMRMAHGSGPAGLVGMRARSRRDGIALARPLLSVSKARLVATARARGLWFAADPSNLDPRFERVRWRMLLPVLSEAGLDADRLGTLATRLARMEGALASQAEAIWPAIVMPCDEAGAVKLGFTALLAHPEEMVLRVLARAVDIVAADDDAVVRLERLESCGFALIEAARARFALTRTLSGSVLTLGRDGVLCVRREPVRKRGVHPAAS